MNNTASLPYTLTPPTPIRSVSDRKPPAYNAAPPAKEGRVNDAPRRPIVPFMKTSPAVIKNGALSPWARLLHTLLLDYHTTEHGCFPGRDRLASDLGTSTRTVDRSLDELCDAGIISKRRRGRGNTNEYFFPDDLTPVSTHNEDDSPPTTTQTDDSPPASTPESPYMSTPESPRVSTKLDVVKQDEINVNSPSTPPTRTGTPDERRRNEIIALWKDLAGITKPLASPPYEDAQALVRAEITDAELTACFQRVKGWATRSGPSLKLIAKELDEYRATTGTQPKASTTAEQLAYLRAGKFTGNDHVMYVSGFGAADNLARDIAGLVAEMEADR